MTKPEPDVLSLIKNRHCCRKFLPFEVPDEHVEKILDAGRSSCSALNLQPIVFYACKDRNKTVELGRRIEKIGLEQMPDMFSVTPDCGQLEKIFYGAPLCIHFAVRKDGYFTRYIDCGIAVSSVLLVAESLGYSTCPVALGKLFGDQMVCEAFGIPEDQDYSLTVCIGQCSPEYIKADSDRRDDNIIIVE
ncbi:putative Nitroreductase family protein [Blattamonas nauphoetae]|uniref:Nitroreductase family protein n=1 Tax=Blattamonas nauphoetae TaxID=2049346 RepID=A0ABQ9Y594_9EUKA|nr:putative Nitroreductase family protein [Blattamonas nauphoetae]